MKPIISLSLIFIAALGLGVLKGLEARSQVEAKALVVTELNNPSPCDVSPIGSPAWRLCALNQGIIK